MRRKAYALNRSKYLDESEYESLIKTLPFFEESSRNRLLVELGLATGARAQELLNLSRADVYVPNKSVLIKGLKGSNDREIPLSDDLFRRLMVYIHSLSGDRLFPVSYHTLYRLWDEVRPCKKTFHSLRHTFALNLYKKHRDIRLVQLALGHRNIQNTEIYMTFVYSTEEMRRLVCD